MIKKLFPILALSVTLVSCLEIGDSHYTPTIGSTPIVRNTTDTLLVYREADGTSRLDTISVGDTIRFAVYYDALGNALLAARVTWDSIYADLTVTPSDSVKTILLPTSEPENGVFYVTTNPKMRWISLPMEYVAIKAGVPTIVFTAESDSKFSPAEIKLKTPIK